MDQEKKKKSATGRPYMLVIYLLDRRTREKFWFIKAN